MKLGMRLAAALLAVGCQGVPERPESVALAEASFEVKGMTCASCNVSVKIAAERVDGVRGARASRRDGKAWVTYDPARTSPSAIATAITSAGYETAPVATPP